MKYLPNISKLLRGQVTAAALLGLALWSSNAFAQDILFVQPVPSPAPATAKPAQANKVANARNVAAAIRLRQTLIFPTVFPNPIAFNVQWWTIDRTSAAYRTAQEIAIRQRAMALRNAALAQRPAPNAARQNAIERQMRRVLEPELKSELSFACRAAGANDDERRTLIVKSKEWFDSFVGDFIKGQDPNQQQMLLQGMQGVWFGGRQPRPENPRDALLKGVAKIVTATLPKEKSTAYEEECRKRHEFERQAAVDNLVERIDEKVKLSPEQWKKIANTLNDHWDDEHAPQLEAFVVGNMWPGIPDMTAGWLYPGLSPAQQAILRRTNTSGTTHVFFGGGVLGGLVGGVNEVIDDIDLETNDAAEHVKR